MRCKVLWPGRLGSSTIANASKISATGNKGLSPTAGEKIRRGNSGDHDQAPRDAERQESDSLNSGAKRGDRVRAWGRVDLALALLFFPPRSETCHRVQILLGKANHVAIDCYQTKMECSSTLGPEVEKPRCLLGARVTTQIQLWMVKCIWAPNSIYYPSS